MGVALFASMGALTTYTEDLADTICARLAAGESLRTICEDPDLPHIATVLRWVDTIPAFGEQYARAREVQADAFAEEIVGIADTCTDAAKARVQIDARKWLAGKLRPKKWGEVERSGGVAVQINNNNTGPVQALFAPRGNE